MTSDPYSAVTVECLVDISGGTSEARGGTCNDSASFEHQFMVKHFGSFALLLIHLWLDHTSAHLSSAMNREEGKTKRKARYCRANTLPPSALYIVMRACSTRRPAEGGLEFVSMERYQAGSRSIARYKRAANKKGQTVAFLEAGCVPL